MQSKFAYLLVTGGLLAIAVVLFTAFVEPRPASGSHVVVRTYEPVDLPGQIVIAYADGTSEAITLEPLNSANHAPNVAKIVQVFDRLEKEGYRMASASGSGSGNPATILHVDTFVFAAK
ncbi:MAG: hypothetical protein AAGB22_05805 [Bacteroidota bacterium]